MLKNGGNVMYKDIAGYLDIENKILLILANSPINISKQLHSIQFYSERNLEEYLILETSPGIIELNPNWSWNIILDPILDIDDNFKIIPSYKNQQH